MTMTAATANGKLGAPAGSIARASVPANRLATFLFFTLGLQQLLLWCFLGAAQWWLVAIGAAAFGGLCEAYRRLEGWSSTPAVDVRVIAACFLISLVVFALGGQGRFFYATADWQVRNAVLHDLVINHWPFAYAVNGQVEMLRAPLGLYLLPAVVGKVGGLRCAEIAMLVQSAAMLTCILSLGAGLFDTRRERIGALIIFLGFSGMDVLGTALVGGRLDMHLEGWAPAVTQYSSHITQAYWVPMHALAGWTGAVLYLLWRRGRLPLAAFLTPLPLLALLSPLALIGVVPFAAHAGFATLTSRSLRPAVIVLPLATLLLAVPSLLYLASGGGTVVWQINPLSIPHWAIFEAIEVIPYLVAVILLSRSTRFGRVVPLLTALTLLLLPWGAIGSAGDLTMRASIPALAMLSVLVAELVLRECNDKETRVLRALVVVTLLIGAVTPLSETVRAIARPRQSLSSCTYFGVVPHGAPTYVTPLTRLARPIAPVAPALVQPKDAPACREINWLDMEERYVGPFSKRSPVSIF